MTAYRDLEDLFRAQVIKDRTHAIERVVQGWGVYLPCVEPKNQVDYVIVGMEPSFGWASSIEDAEKKVRKGQRNFCRPDDDGEPLAIFMHSVDRFLCKKGEKYHLTDVSKGAMPGAVAGLDRARRYEEWYPLLLKEIEIVGKCGAPIIAIGRDVDNFLKRRDIEGETGRPLHTVPHYSPQAGAHFKGEAEKDRQGFEAFKKSEFGEGSCWQQDLSLAKKRMVFVYKKQFEKIQACG